MYLARTINKGKTHYFIRESNIDEGQSYFKSRDLFDLGFNPGNFIHYIEEHAFYIDPDVEKSLKKQGINPSDSEMEDLFWPFLKPEIRNRIDQFKHKNQRFTLKKLTQEETEYIEHRVHIFDKRRLHYLRYGSLNQASLYKAPLKMFRPLINKSRDEIEHYFMAQENILDYTEYRQYVYVIFNLQRFFSETAAQVMPGGLDQEKLDALFEEESCSLYSDTSFWAGLNEKILTQYLSRYAIMFFDYDFESGSSLDDYLRQFMNNRRTFKFPEKKVAMQEASRLFGVSQEELKKMGKRDLTRLYRKLAHEHHPDKGGEHEEFVKLTETYNQLLKTKK
jgi:hypothetical protein